MSYYGIGLTEILKSHLERWLILHMNKTVTVSTLLLAGLLFIFI